MNLDITVPSPQQISANPWLLDELETDDLLSLRAHLHDDPYPELDDLWTLVCIRTGSLGS